MYFYNFHGLERLTFLLFNRNIIPLSVFLDEVMKLLSCDSIHDHRPNTGKRRNSYLESVCDVLFRICSDLAFWQFVLTLHVNAFRFIRLHFTPPIISCSHTVTKSGVWQRSFEHPTLAESRSKMCQMCDMGEDETVEHVY